MSKFKNEITNIKINVPAQRNPLLQQALENINNDEELKALWTVININAMQRLNMSDHGYVHFQIVANIAIKMARMLNKNNIQLNMQKDYELDFNYSELVLLLSSIMHDLGMTISRKGHEEFSLIIANKILDNILNFLPTIEKTIVKSETLHAIISHRKDGKPYTIEAGILRVADALDMSEGRSRIPFEAGAINIHSVSAAAINKIEITDGENKPIQINILMNNSAGLFQVDDLLNEKLKGSGIENFVSVRAYIESETEKNLIKEFLIK